MTGPLRSAPRKGAIGLGALVLALVFLALTLAADAQPARKVPTVGYVGLPTDSAEPRWQDGFARGLREAGHVPGQTIVVEVRSYTTGDELRKVLDDFVRQKVDVIFVGQPFVALAARQATRDTPIVCGSCGDPIENGLAKSLANPGGNVTGLASLSAELIRKRVALMKEALPGASRHAVFVFPSNPGTRATSRALDAAGRTLGVEIQRIEIRRPGDVAEGRSASGSRRTRGGLRGSRCPARTDRIRAASVPVRRPPRAGAEPRAEPERLAHSAFRVIE